MYFRRACLFALSVCIWMPGPAAAQSVVSTHAGVVHYFEGTVAIGGEALQQQFGRFPEVAEGSELRTAEGRAELLLGPGVILRVAEDSAVKMISGSLTDTRIELKSGTAILQSKDALPGNAVTISYKDWQVHAPAKGTFRIDASPAQLRVYDGEIEVRAGQDAPVTVKAGQTLPLAAVLVPDQTLGPPGDVFNSWAFDRSEAIAADNATAAQIVDDPALYPDLANASGLSLAGYTYFPPTMGNPYMSYSPYGPRPYGLSPYATPYSFGYGFGSGYGFGGYPVGSFYRAMPGRTVLPSLPLHMPASGSYYPRPVTSYPTTRPGIISPSMPRAAPAPAIHGGRH